MKNPTPDFLPLTPRQKKLLETIKALKEKQKTLPPGDPITLLQVPEFYEIQEEIDELSPKALRSGLLRGRPAETRRLGFWFVFDSTGEYAEPLPGFGDFHPDLPPWAKDHFIEWIRMHGSGIRGPDSREILRKSKIVGIETGTKRPKDMAFLRRVLELRGYEVKDDPGKEDGPIPDSLGEALDESLRLVVTDEMLKQREAGEKKKTRTRKERQPWTWVIKKLVEEGLVKKVKTPSGEKSPSVQAFKKRLKIHYRFWPWEET